MPKAPSFQFYPGDWLKDPAIRICSFAAQGVWINMLCLMSESEERGVLITGSRPWSERQTAVVIGGNVDATLALIQELLSNGVARKREDGAIFSARMVRDEHLRRVRKRCGSKGGNPLLVNQTPNQITEDEDEDSEAFGGGVGGGDPLDAMIVEIYAEYPLKVGKPAALKAIHGAIRRGYEPSMLREKTSAYASSVKGTDTILPHPSTWFNQDRFNDEPSTWVRQHVNGQSKAQLIRIRDMKQERMAELKRKHFSETQSIIGGKYVPAGWRDTKAHAEHSSLKTECQQLTERISKIE